MLESRCRPGRAGPQTRPALEGRSRFSFAGSPTAHGSRSAAREPLQVYHLGRTLFARREGPPAQRLTVHERTRTRTGLGLRAWPRAQAEIDRRNAAFWDELCGTGLRRQLGISGALSRESGAVRRRLSGDVPVPRRLPAARKRARASGCSRSVSATAPSARFWPGADSITTGLTSPRDRSRWSATGCGQLGVDDADRARAGRLGPPDGLSGRELRSRRHHRLPAPHRRPPASRERGEAGPAPGRPGGGDALQPAFLPAAENDPRQTDQRAEARGRGDAQALRQQPRRRGRPDHRVHVQARGEAAVRGLLDGPRAVARTSTRSPPSLGRRPRRLLGWPARLAGLDLYIVAVK